MINRREFLGTVAAVVPALRWQGTPANEWGAPVFDLHFHLRPQPAANLAHLDGAGITKANLLTRGRVLDQVKALQAAAPGRFTWFNSYDVTQPDAEQVLTQAVKSGAQGFGEMKFHVAADGPELRRMYALAADLRVPILIHFQEVDHTPNEGTWSTGFAKAFEAVLKAYPRTTFIGHADAFWANVSADYHNDAAYPTGPITRGGVTDRLLGDYSNLFGTCPPSPVTARWRAIRRCAAEFQELANSLAAKRLSAADERHFRRHDRHELHIRIERKTCHVDHGSHNVCDVQTRLRGGLAVG